MIKFSVTIITFLIWSNSFGQDSSECIIHTDTLSGISYFENPQSPPKFKKNNSDLTNYILEYIQPTLDSHDFLDVNLSAIISLVINSEGQVLSASIIRPTDYRNIDSKIIQAILEMPKWHPAKCNNENVNVRIEVPLQIIIH